MTPEEVPRLGAKDLSRRRDRQAAVVLAIACIGLLSPVVGLTDFDGGAFQG